MYKTLLGRVYNVLTHRRLILFYFVLLTVLLITLVQTHFNISLGEVVKKNGLSLTLVFLLSVSFILLKSCAWFWAWRSQEICVSYVGSLKLFLMASFVDLFVYPSKISSDLFLISCNISSVFDRDRYFFDEAKFHFRGFGLSSFGSPDKVPPKVYETAWAACSFLESFGFYNGCYCCSDFF